MPTVNRSSTRDPGCDSISWTPWELGVAYFHAGYEIDDDPVVLYPRSDQVTHSGIDYKCILNHVSSAANEPGSGASWETYWELGYRHYTEDEDNYYYLDPADPILTVRPDLANKKFKGYRWKLCPFSTQWYNYYRGDVDENPFAGKGLYPVRTTSGGTTTTVFYEVQTSEQTDHTRTGGRMRFERRGSVAGWICDDLDCYHYTTENPGTKFYQV